MLRRYRDRDRGLKPRAVGLDPALEEVLEATRVGDRFDIPLHLLLLSPDEVRETGFVEFEDAVQIWP
jgi:hypothetical protein